jgi:hypothetical protein
MYLIINNVRHENVIKNIHPTTLPLYAVYRSIFSNCVTDPFLCNAASAVLASSSLLCSKPAYNTRPTPSSVLDTSSIKNVMIICKTNDKFEHEEIYACTDCDENAKMKYLIDTHTSGIWARPTLRVII